MICDYCNQDKSWVELTLYQKPDGYAVGLCDDCYDNIFIRTRYNIEYYGNEDDFITPEEMQV